MILDTIQHGEIKMWARYGSSDHKAIHEVITNRSYAKRGLKIDSTQTWLDLGANCGAFSVFACSEGATHVTPFEPDPDSAHLVRENLKRNGFYSGDVMERAVVHDASIENISFSRHPTSPWRNSTKKNWKGGEVITVPTVPFSSLVDTATHCKMDIEGAEIDILRFTQDFGSIKVLIFEWHFDIQPFTSYFHQAIDNLKKHFSDIRGADIDRKLEVYKFFPAARVVYCFR